MAACAGRFDAKATGKVIEGGSSSVGLKAHGLCLEREARGVTQPVCLGSKCVVFGRKAHGLSAGV